MALVTTLWRTECAHASVRDLIFEALMDLQRLPGSMSLYGYEQLN